MLKNKPHTQSYINFIDEINATSGKLRYDPINEAYYLSMNDDEKIKAIEIILEKFSGDDERIPALAFKIIGSKVIEKLKEALAVEIKPAPWRLAALQVLFEESKNNSYLEEIHSTFFDDELPIDIRRLAFSYIEGNPRIPGMMDKFMGLYLTIKDIPLKYKLEKYLAL